MYKVKYNTPKFSFFDKFQHREKESTIALKTELLHIFMIDFSKGWGVRRHSHSFYQIWYVIEGEAEYYLNGRTMKISVGDLIFMPPGTMHELPVMCDGLLRYVDVKFLIEDEELRKECEKLPLVMRLDDKSVTDSILKCREYWYERGQYSREISKLVFEQIVLQILQIQMSQGKKQQLWIPVKKNMENLRGVAADIAHYIDSHYAEEFTLENLADALRYNKAYLCKLFKDATGLTIINYLNYVRISRAYDLICYTSNSMSHISLMVGFSSVHYFARMFKKICGMPPGEIRELQKDSILRDTRLHGNFNYRYYVDLRQQEMQDKEQTRTNTDGGEAPEEASE